MHLGGRRLLSDGHVKSFIPRLCSKTFVVCNYLQLLVRILPLSRSLLKHALLHALQLLKCGNNKLPLINKTVAYTSILDLYKSHTN